MLRRGLMKTQARAAVALLFGLVLAAGGCEKKHDQAEHPHEAHGDHKHGDHKHGEGHAEGEGHHHDKDMSPPLKSFHDVLAPVYHAEKGPGRVDKTCADAPAMTKGAAAVANEEGVDHTTARKERDEALTKSVADLETACKGDKAGVEAALEKVHDAFHAFLKEK